MEEAGRLRQDDLTISYLNHPPLTPSGILLNLLLEMEYGRKMKKADTRIDPPVPAPKLKRCENSYVT